MIRSAWLKLSLPFALALSTLVGGCATRYIPNTDVEDTRDNRDVVKFCELYRHAVEEKDIATILSMVSPNYYEDGGNVDPTDDLDFQGLRDWLETQFLGTKAIRYEIRYRRVEKGERNRVYVLYTYSASYKIPGIRSDEEWHHTVADNRIELEKEGDQFKIVAGM